MQQHDEYYLFISNG